MQDLICLFISITEHNNKLGQVFQTLRNLKVQLVNSEFLRKEVEFFRHVETLEGIKPYPKKIDATKRFPLPKT